MQATAAAISSSAGRSTIGTDRWSGRRAQPHSTRRPAASSSCSCAELWAPSSRRCATDPAWSGGTAYTDNRERPVNAAPADLWRVIEAIGVSDAGCDEVVQAMGAEFYAVAPGDCVCDVARVMGQHKYGCAVVVDAKDNVYVHSRSQQAVIVLDRKGKVLSDWGAEFACASAAIEACCNTCALVRLAASEAMSASRIASDARVAMR